MADDCFFAEYAKTSCFDCAYCGSEILENDVKFGKRFNNEKVNKSDYLL